MTELQAPKAVSGADRSERLMEYGTPLHGTTMHELCENHRITSEQDLAEYLAGYDAHGEDGASNDASYWEDGKLYITFPSLYHAQGDYLI